MAGFNDIYFSYTYYYGNGDHYTGYGYGDSSLGYYSGQYKYTDEYGYSNYNETYNNGYYYIDYVYNYGYDQGFGIGESNIYLTNYTDWGYDYDGLGTASFTTTYNVSSYEGYSGLGSEYGYAYNSSYNNSDAYVSNYYSADLSGANNNDIYFSYTYYYGNGDHYTGYGYGRMPKFMLHWRENDGTLKRQALLCQCSVVQGHENSCFSCTGMN